MKIPFVQIAPKDGGILNPYAADPLGRDKNQQQAHIPPTQGTDGKGAEPGTVSDDDCSCMEPTMK